MSYDLGNHTHFPIPIHFFPSCRLSLSSFQAPIITWSNLTSILKTPPLFILRFSQIHMVGRQCCTKCVSTTSNSLFCMMKDNCGGLSKLISVSYLHPGSVAWRCVVGHARTARPWSHRPDSFLHGRPTSLPSVKENKRIKIKADSNLDHICII